MIDIKFYEDKKTHQISRIEMKGHAESGELGQDIVCAAVSSLVITTLNYLEKIDCLDENQVEADEENGGYLAVQFFLLELEEVVFMTDYLYFGLSEIQATYPQNLRVQKNII